MTFQFSCPQGHILQGEMSQIGQLFQCPFCGESFSIPSPDATSHPTMGGEFMQGLPPWPADESPQGYPQQDFAPQPLPVPMRPLPPMQPKQDAAAVPEGGQPSFVLGFDPHAKAPLPFELPGNSAAKFSLDKPATQHLASSAVPVPDPPLAPLEVAHSEGIPATNFADLSGLTDEPKKVRVLHIRCPAGHALKVNREQHGKPVRCSVCKQVFEVRYENSLEFQRRTEKVVSRANAKEGQSWLAWAIFAAFVVLTGLVALIMYANRP